MARSLFPNGIEINHQKNIIEASEETNNIIHSTNTVYNPAFIYKNLSVRIDILNKVEDGFFDLIDICGNSSPKLDNYLDIGFQKFILQKLGFKIRSTIALSVDSNKFHELPIYSDSFFKFNYLNDKIDYYIKEISNKINYLQSLPKKEPPEINIQSCKSPKECKLPLECWNFQEDMDIFYLRENHELAKKLFHNKIYYLREIPEGEELTRVQQIQVNCAKSDCIYIDRDAILDFLNQLQSTIYYLDFEAINPVIPIYSKTKPFQHIPFLFSLHIENNENIEHITYIEEDNIDPRFGILERLSRIIQPEGKIICYNDTIEKKCIKEAVVIFPEFQDWWDKIKDNFIDLSYIFKNMYYYNPEQKGSTSLKSVIKPLTGLEYKNLTIQEGVIANREFLRLKIEPFLEDSLITKIKNDLIEYCTMDTYSMLKIIRKLKDLTNNIE